MATGATDPLLGETIVVRGLDPGLAAAAQIPGSEIAGEGGNSVGPFLRSRLDGGPRHQTGDSQKMRRVPHDDTTLPQRAMEAQW